MLFIFLGFCLLGARKKLPKRNSPKWCWKMVFFLKPWYNTYKNHQLNKFQASFNFFCWWSSLSQTYWSQAIHSGSCPKWHSSFGLIFSTRMPVENEKVEIGILHWTGDNSSCHPVIFEVITLLFYVDSQVTNANPIGSMGLVYMPTWMVDFYGFHVGRYANIHRWY